MKKKDPIILTAKKITFLVKAWLRNEKFSQKNKQTQIEARKL